MRRFLFLWCCYVMASDHYVFMGDFSQMDIYQHDNMLLIKDISGLTLLEQPDQTTQSYLSDFSESDAVLEVKEGSYCVIKHHDTLNIGCYDKKDDKGKMHILIDAGHGGKDAGAVSQNGLKEKHVTLSYVKKLAKYLELDWVKVDLTRQRDIYIDKYDRLRMALRIKPDMVLSVHADAYVQPSASGVGLFHLDNSHGSNLSQSLIKDHKSDKDMRMASKVFANQILSQLRGDYKLHLNNAEALPLVILRSPMSLSMLLELGFLSNPEEASYLGSENYLEGFAEDMAKILLNTWKKQEGIIYVSSFN